MQIEKEEFSIKQHTEGALPPAAVKKSAKEVAPHTGHRQRLKERLAKDKVGDAELLEYFLFDAIPRRNTNDIAHELLRKFGSLYAIANASEEELKATKGVGDSVVTVIRTLKFFCERYNHPDVPGPKAPLSDEFWEYLTQSYAFEFNEVIDLFLIDKNSYIFKSMRLATGTNISAKTTPMEIAKALVEFSPYAVVIVHNHPFETADPSPEDKDMTKQCQLLCNMHNVKLYDHIIYSPYGKYSFCDSGKMQRIALKFSVKNLVALDRGK